MTHEAFAKGGLCGRCHNGTISFAPDKNCVKCHAAGLPGSERMIDTATAGLTEIEQTAKRLGSGWKASRLENGALPIDRFGDIDWETLQEEDVWRPLQAPDAKDTDESESRQTVVVFKPAIPGVKHVAFEHAPHTSQISCANCHKKIFEETAGATPVSMEAIASGKFCGACHGKTAFKLADCNRCHAIAPDRIPDGALVRQ
jgi:c(7)-type cytochrome triheme protein